MPADINALGRKRVLLLASNPAVSKQTGWPIGFWWSELTHPYWELTQAGYDVDIVSPDGGPLRFADAYVGQTIQPFRIEDEARRLPDTNFIVAGRFRPHAVRDGLLITGQQQYSGTAVAQLILQALGH